MRAQQASVAEVERVVHRARRMIGGTVQRFEIVEVVLDLGTELNAKARGAEDRLDAQPRARDRVQRTARRAATGQRDVDAAFGELLLDRGAVEQRTTGLDRLVQADLGLVDASTRGWTFGGTERAETLEQFGEGALLAEHRDTHGLQRGDIGGLLNVVECPVQQSV